MDMCCPVSAVLTNVCVIQRHDIRMDPMEMGWKGVDWIHLAQNTGSVKGR